MIVTLPFSKKVRSWIKFALVPRIRFVTKGISVARILLSDKIRSNGVPDTVPFFSTYPLTTIVWPLNLPFIASLFEIFLMYFNIIEWQVKYYKQCIWN